MGNPIGPLANLAPRGSTRTVRAPCHVFEQLSHEMVYQERGCRWYLVGFEALPFPLVGFEWLLLFPTGP